MHASDNGLVAGISTGPLTIPGDIAEWEYDPVRARICAWTKDGQVVFISGIRDKGGVCAFPLVAGDTVSQMWLYPEHGLMVLAGRMAAPVENAVVYLWRLSQPGRYLRLIPSGHCPPHEALQVHLSQDGTVLLVGTTGYTDLFRVVDGARIHDLRGSPSGRASKCKAQGAIVISGFNPSVSALPLKQMP